MRFKILDFRFKIWECRKAVFSLLITHYSLPFTRNSQLATIFLSILLLSTSGCKEKKTDFDRKPLLENLGNNIIIPAYKNAHEKALALKNAITDFTASPDVAKLQAAKLAFKEAYNAWQAIEFYDFAKGAGLSYGLNNFPPDTAKIQSNILSGNYDLLTGANVKARGFPALDYLLFQSTDEQAIVDGVNNFQYAKKYLNDVANDVSSNITAVYDDWNTAYINTFINATGIDAGSSTAILINTWAQYTERTRRERVGNALGYIGFVNSGSINEKLLEAFYAGYSKELLIANLQAGKNLFTGGSGQGFDDYPAVKEASYQGTPLNEEISKQYDKCIAAANAISSDFKTALVNEKPKMETLFLELKKLTVLIKVDLASAVGVTISYTDNDGD
jgi:predicted lipoprotein